MSTNFDKFAQITNWMMLLEKNTQQNPLGHISRRNKNTNLKRYTHPNVHSSAFYSSQDMEAT